MASFLFSKSNAAILPKTNGEVALWGRSNVGKSSLINAILREKLAKTSSLPGKTRTINFYKTNNKEILVDLPGYSYSRLSKRTKENINILLSEYIVKRRELLSIFLIVDSKVGPNNQDIEIINFLRENNKNYHLVLSKSDKANQSQLQATKKKFRDLGFKEELLKTSVRKGVNLQELRKLISLVFIDAKQTDKYDKI